MQQTRVGLIAGPLHTTSSIRPNVPPQQRHRRRRAAAAAGGNGGVAAAAQQLALACDPSPGLRLFLDSADVALWRRYAPTGTLWGVTTNPAILERDAVPCTLESAARLCDEAAALGFRELQLQAWGGPAPALAAAAAELQDLRPRHCPGVTLTIKLPCTPDGLAAAKALRAARPGCSVTITGVYAAHQCLLAAAAGADYVAPYLGRMGDAIGHDEAMAEVASMRAAMAAAAAAGRPPPRVLVASIRKASHMALLAAGGCDTFTFSPAVMDEMLGLPATAAAIADFEAAAARNGGAKAAAAAAGAKP
ncbi:MAG: hypothetical protein J3K34DRAFT_233337 [Monoraphidium minutum]|nr:MAG: hypothetical protein J3K34DRAFT_233337 [Monoraphidium minutum]